MSRPAVIECRNLIKIHKQGKLEVVALQGLDFAMGEGEFISVVGKSGAGKSTLLRIIAGLEEPSAGQVEVAGVRLSDLDGRGMTEHYRSSVGFLWQDFRRNIVPYLGPRANVELPMTLAGVSARKRKARALELLDAVGLRNRLHADVSTMSGGEQQRLALCVALAQRPRLLLADEPTGELDTGTSLEIYQLLRTLNDHEGLSILVVTHDVALAQRSDRIVRIADGVVATEDERRDPLDLAVGHGGVIEVPRDLLMEAGIGDQAMARLIDDGILLTPPPAKGGQDDE